MAGKRKLRHTAASVAQLEWLQALLRKLPGTDKCIAGSARCGMFEVTGEMDTDDREAIGICLSDDDSVPDALDMDLILKWLCAEGHMDAGTWIILN